MNEDEQIMIEVLENVLEMINECGTTKQSTQLEIQLGEDRKGDTILVSVNYVKKKKNKQDKKEMLN